MRFQACPYLILCTVMLKKNKTREYCWALWIGMFMIFFSWIWNILNISQLLGISESKRDILGGFYSNGLLVNVAIMCLAAPIFEEVSFRLWCKDKKIYYIISTIFASIAYGYVYSWYCAVIPSVTMLYCGLFIKKRETRITLMIIATSILFGCAHYNTYASITPDSIIDQIDFIGFGLIASYLAINFGFLWAPILHIIINTILIAVLLFTWGNANYSFSTQSYEIHVRPTFEQGGGCYFSGTDTLIAQWDMPHIAYFIHNLNKTNDTTFFESHSRILYKTSDISGMRYRATVISKGTNSYHYDEVVQALIDNNLVKTDTTYEPIWFLSVENADLLNQKASPDGGNIDGLVSLIRVHYNLPLVTEDGVNSQFPLKIDHNEFDNLGDITPLELSSYLESKYGLKITCNPNQRMQVIKFQSGKETI